MPNIQHKFQNVSQLKSPMHLSLMYNNKADQQYRQQQWWTLRALTFVGEFESGHVAFDTLSIGSSLRCPEPTQ